MTDSRITVFYNLDAEDAVLGAFVKRKTTAAENIGSLTENDFYSTNNGKIFVAIRALVSQKSIVELPALAEAMKQLYGNDDLMQDVIEILKTIAFNSEFALKQNIEIIKSLSLRRDLYKIMQNSMDCLSDGTQSETAVLDNTRQALRDIVVTGHTWHTMADVLQATFESLERKSKGEEPSMPSGIKALDKLTTGFHKGELTVVGARPSVGKSAFAAHVALMAAQKGYKVGIVSREMTDVQYGLRILARGTGIDNDKLRTGSLENSDWDTITDTMLRYAGVSINFMFSTRYVEDLRMEVQGKVDSGDLDLLVIDYMQLLQTKRKYEKDYMRIGYVSKALKDMTVDLNIAIIALAQVGRSAQNTMPTMAELRGSGDIEQDADNIIFIHRPDDINDENIRPEDKPLYNTLKNEGRQYIVLKVDKQRQGSIGRVAVAFDPARMRYTSICKNLEE